MQIILPLVNPCDKSRITDYGSRITDHGSRIAYPWLIAVINCITLVYAPQVADYLTPTLDMLAKDLPEDRDPHPPTLTLTSIHVAIYNIRYIYRYQDFLYSNRYDFFVVRVRDK